MKIYFAADHAGFELKQELLNFVRGELSFKVEDCGAIQEIAGDDYPPIIARASEKLSQDAALGIDSRAIFIGASGQGEAMVANRFPYVRAAVYYGPPVRHQTDASGMSFDIIQSTRVHNDANALSLGARFLTLNEAKDAVRTWLSTAFSDDGRHKKRVKEIEEYPAHEH